MEFISDNQKRENLILQFDEFLEYVDSEFGLEIDCHKLVSSVEYAELFEHMYFQVSEFCSEDINDKIADLVSTIEENDTIQFDELENIVIEISNMIENISYRHTTSIDTDRYVNTLFSIPSGGLPYGSKKSSNQDSLNLKEDEDLATDEEDRDVVALIKYIKAATKNNDISWFETNLLDKISEFSLVSLNMNPHMRIQVDKGDVIRSRTFYAAYDYDKCVSKLEEMFDIFSFEDEEDIKQYTLILFVTIETRNGITYNALSLINFPEDNETSRQTVSSCFLFASIDSNDEILNLIDENIESFGDMSEVDDEDILSADMGIAYYETRKTFMSFYKGFLKKMPENYVEEALRHLDPLVERFSNQIAYHQLKKTTIQIRKFLLSLGIEPNNELEDTSGYCDDCKSIVTNIKAYRCANSNTIALNIDEPEYMSFSNSERGFVVYLDLEVVCDKPIKLKFCECFLYTNGRQWTRDYNYTGYDFDEETIKPGKPRKIGWIWINQNWLIKKLVKNESYITATFKDSENRLYFLKYVYSADKWKFDDYYEVVDN